MTKATRKVRNQRRFQRRSACSRIKVTCRKNGPVNGGRHVIAFPLDVSEGGARLLVEGPFEAGEEVVLGFEARSHQRPLTQHGHVVWAFQVTELSYAVGIRWKERLCKDDFRQVTVHPVRLDY